jgi:hypothetical protein
MATSDQPRERLYNLKIVLTGSIPLKLSGEYLLLYNIPANTTVHMLKNEIIQAWSNDKRHKDLDISTKILKCIFRGRCLKDIEKIGMLINDHNAYLFENTSNNVKVIVFHLVLQDKSDAIYVEETAEEEYDDQKSLRTTQSSNGGYPSLRDCCNIF